MGRSMSKAEKNELLTTIRDRYQHSTKRDKGRILDEFAAVTGLHRKHAIRLLTRRNDQKEQQPSLAGRRAYDEAVREAVIVVREASDRIRGKHLKTALPHLVESIKRIRGAPQSPATGLPGQGTVSYRQRILPGQAAEAHPFHRWAAVVVGDVGSPWDTECRYGPTTTGTTPPKPKATVLDSQPPLPNLRP